MRTKIYQINSKRDVNRVKFEGLDLLERYQGSSAVDPSIYDEVFNAEIDETDLEAIYQRFNTVGHPLHRGHSLSVSDVVVNDNGAFFCDSIGFQPISFDESQTQKPDNLMRVVYVEPHKAPYIADVAHMSPTRMASSPPNTMSAAPTGRSRSWTAARAISLPQATSRSASIPRTILLSITAKP